MSPSAGPSALAQTSACEERHAGSHEGNAPRIGGIREPDLERQGRVLGASGWRFFVFGLIVALPGIALVVFSDGWARAIGIGVAALAGCPVVVVGGGLLLSSLVARWSARHKLFA